MYHINIKFGDRSVFSGSQYRLSNVSRQFVDGFKFATGITGKSVEWTANLDTFWLSSFYILLSNNITPDTKLSLRSGYNHEIVRKYRPETHHYITLITCDNTYYVVRFNSADFLSGVKTYVNYVKHTYAVSIVDVGNYSLNILYRIQHYYIDSRLNKWVGDYNHCISSILCLRRCKVIDAVAMLILKFLLGSQFPKPLNRCGSVKHIEECRSRILDGQNLCEVCSCNMKHPYIIRIKLVEFN
jgi:hypothetical protein